MKRLLENFNESEDRLRITPETLAKPADGNKSGARSARMGVGVANPEPGRR